MDDFDAYAGHYLAQWDKRATVRGAARTHLPAGVGRIEFPQNLLPMVRMPRVQALGQAALDTLLTRSAIEWQATVADGEVFVIAELCGRLSANDIAFAMPRAARQVALTIATDEMYHAYVAREFMDEITAATGLPPAPGDGGGLLRRAVEMLRQDVDPRFVAEAETMAVCFAENLITEELIGYSRPDTEPTIFQVITREHLVDEGRHARFFTLLLTRLWATATPACREALAAVLPRFLDRFLWDRDSFRQRQLDMLESLGFSPTEREEIIAEAAALAVVPDKATHGSTANSRRLIAAAGLDRDPATRAALAASGWLREPQAA